ncbi:exonuclease 1-like [Oscarella lobularis]|uniref:exonuclease 1-like n=1 Tax=Oscarella lobularis TaxID=121494 RepID=UPI0033144C6C
MGIQGLIPFLKDIHEKISISEYAGKRVAIDAYCWLHRGAYACAFQLAQGIKADQYVKYILKRVNMLRYWNVTPVLVFDGGHLPSKAGKEAERRKRRKDFRLKGLQQLAEGQRSKAVDCFQKCIDVTPEMAKEVMDACKVIGVQCIVAPYEADAQLAYLRKKNFVQLIITEDSDLLVFGCKEVMFKMDESGNGILVNLSRLNEVKGMHSFTLDSFRHMCILSGCDYLASVAGMGLVTARKMMIKCGMDPLKVIRLMRMSGMKKVPEDYAEEFEKADMTFLYQVVFDPIEETRKPLNELPDGLQEEELTFSGMYFSPRKSKQISYGKMNPIDHGVFKSNDDSFQNQRISSPPTKPNRPGNFGGAIAFQPRPKSSKIESIELTSDNSDCDDADVVGQYKIAEGRSVSLPLPPLPSLPPPVKVASRSSRRSLFQKEHATAMQSGGSQFSRHFDFSSVDPVQDFKTKRLSRQKDSVFSCLEDKDEKKEDDDKETDIEEAKENKDFVCIESESEEEEKEIPTKAADVSYGSGASSGEAVTETKRQQQQRNLQRQHTVGLSKKFKRDLGESRQVRGTSGSIRSLSKRRFSEPAGKRLGLKGRRVAAKNTTNSGNGNILSWARVRDVEKP